MENLACKNLSFTYAGAEEPAVSNVSFSVERGEFVAICGATGSGKSTLLRLLKRELTPLGELSGSVTLEGRPIAELPAEEAARRIGFVMQRPEQQLVTDKVWHELAFGLENLGTPQEVIRRRVSEMASYFGIEDWFERDVSTLSGGQKQLLNLAAVMVMNPDILLLDEPTAMLDPIAAADFIATLHKLNRELSLTILLIEHRLEDVIGVADRILALEDGRLLVCEETRRAVEKLSTHALLMQGMPAAVRLYAALGASGPCPLDVREGRAFVEKNYADTVRSLACAEGKVSDTPALELRDVFFRYERNGRDILRGLSLTVSEREIFCILGGNGSGKSTTLSVAAGIRRAYAGSVRVFGKKLRDYPGQSLYKDCLALLPQDVQTVFLRNTLREELAECGADLASLPFDLTPLLERHPYDLSGGQQQMAAIAKVLAAKPRLLLLDEPGKGLDAAARAELIALLRTLRERGLTIVIVTHDVEFAAECADRCAMFFRGEITSVGAPHEFFSGNSFYTTAASRMTRGQYEGAVTVAEAAALCRLNGKREGSIC